MYDGVVFAHGFFDWVTVAPLGVRTGALRLGEGVRSDRGHVVTTLKCSGLLLLLFLCSMM